GELPQLASLISGCKSSKHVRRQAQQQILTAPARGRKDVATRRRKCQPPRLRVKGATPGAAKGVNALLPLESEPNQVAIGNVTHLVRRCRQHCPRKAPTVTVQDRSGPLVSLLFRHEARHKPKHLPTQGPQDLIAACAPL